MAEKIVSPGVFTNEKDLSFLPSGVAQIGAAIVGPTPKGPAFVPTVIRTYDDFAALYGDTEGNYYVPYAVKSYLKSASVVTVVRIVHEGGYSVTAKGVTVGGTLVGALLPTRTYGAANGSSAGFAPTVGPASIAVAPDTYTVSYDTGSSDYITKVIGTSVDGSKLAYAYLWFKNAATALGTVGASGANLILDFTADGFNKPSPAATPWITSQGANPEKLFRVLTLGDGDLFNRSYKISIINNTLAGNLPGTDYGSFTILVRQYGDSDQNPTVLETYSNLTLDPDSPNFIARRIGDTGYEVRDNGEVIIIGDYRNVSKHIRVEVTDAIKRKAADPGLNPYGHEAYMDPIPSTAALPPVPTITSDPQINGAYSTRAYYGMNFNDYDHWNFLRPIPSASAANAALAFNLDNCTVSLDYGTPGPGTLLVSGAAGQPADIVDSTLKGADVQNIAKFTVAMQGGFDGMDMALPLYTGTSILPNNTLGLECSGVNSSGSLGYRKAFNVLANAETYDINMMALPGITIEDHPTVVERAITMATDRGDTFLVLDPVRQGKTVAEAVGAVAISGLDTSYAATYWPWVKIMDTNRFRPIWVPASAVLPRVIAQSDTAAFEWFAPAGLNRGGILDAVDVESKLSFAQRDTLYEARINPIATFPAQGVCVWGQKTLQTKASALDRVNVRRLMITLKKYIASATRYLVFENNTNETRNRFINIVTPYLENVKARQGLYAFRVVMDETNNTPDVIDRNQLYGQIFLQPAKTAEFIILDFNILPTGASFDNA